MAEKKLSVVIAAKEFLSGTLRSLKRSVKDWSEGVTKIAAGIGLADGFKEVGKFIKESVAQAAEAYPKLAAPFKQLQATFTELRVQGGAALLEALRPATPLLQDILEQGVSLAKQLPDAIDGVRITWVRFTTKLREFPDLARQVFGAVLTTIADFARTAGPYLDTILGTDTVAFSDRLSARGAALSQQGIRGQRATTRARDARVLRIAQRTHDFGPRAEPERPDRLPTAGPPPGGDGGGQLTAAERTAIERGLREYAAQHYGTRSGPAGPDLSNPEQVLTNLPGALGATTAPEAAPAGVGRIEFGAAFKDAIEPLKAFNEEARSANEVLGDLAGSAIVAVTDSLGDMAVQLGKTGQVVSNPIKAVKGMLGAIAKEEGKYHIKRGAAIIAEGGWPPNPAAVLAGLKEIAAGTALAAFGGAAEGGGSGGRGGGRFYGGTSPGRFAQDQQAAQDSRGSLTVEYDKGFVEPGDPAFQALIAETVAKGQYRQLVFRARN